MLRYATTSLKITPVLYEATAYNLDSMYNVINEIHLSMLYLTTVNHDHQQIFSLNCAVSSFSCIGTGQTWDIINSSIYIAEWSHNEKDPTNSETLNSRTLG